MKRNLSILLLLFMLCSYHNVNASSCSYKEQAELNSEVAKIKVKYEEKTGALDPSKYSCEGGGECEALYYYFGITILNMSENFYIQVQNDKTNEKKTYYYNDVKDGIITFDYKNIEEITNFTFKVYSSTKTGCSSELYRTIYLTTPRINEYYNYLQCVNNPEHYLCQKYVTVEKVSFGDFQQQITDYENQNKSGNNKNDKRNIIQKFFDFIDDHKTLIIISSFVVAAGVTSVVIIKKRKQSL